MKLPLFGIRLVTHRCLLQRVLHASRGKYISEAGRTQRHPGDVPDATPRLDHKCTIMVYTGAMPMSKQVRRSLTLPAQVAKQVDSIAKRRRLSDNRVLVELIELGIEARERKERAFFELAERFRASQDPEEVKRLGDELGQFVFGE